MTSLTVKHTRLGVGGQQQQRVGRGPGGRDLRFPTFVGICWFFRFDLQRNTHRNNNKCFSTTRPPVRRSAYTHANAFNRNGERKIRHRRRRLIQYSLRVVYIPRISYGGRTAAANVRVGSPRFERASYDAYKTFRPRDLKTSKSKVLPTRTEITRPLWYSRLGAIASPNPVDEIVSADDEAVEFHQSAKLAVRGKKRIRAASAAAPQLFHYRADKEKHIRDKTIIRTRERIKNSYKTFYSLERILRWNVKKNDA